MNNMYRSETDFYKNKRRVRIITGMFEISLLLMLFQNNVFPNVYTSNIYSIVILAGVLMCFLIKNKYYHRYLTYYLCFIVYYIVLSLLFHERYSEFSNNRIFTMLVIWIMLIFIYNYIIISNSPDRFMKLYIVISAISLIVIITLLGERVFSSRLGHNGMGTTVSYYFFGNVISKSSNSTARFCAIAAFFSLYFAMDKKKKIYYIPFILFCSGVVLSGSRKGLLILILFVLYSIFSFSRSEIYIRIFVILITAMLISISIFKITFLYEQIGQRMLVLFNNMFSDVYITGDGNSYGLRSNIKDIAKSYIIKKPLFGVGLGVFSRENMYNGFLIGTENNYLDILVSGGIFALGLYYSYVIMFINKYKTIIKSQSKYLKIMSIIVLSGIITDFGSMTYFLINSLMWIIILFAFMKVDNKSVA